MTSWTALFLLTSVSVQSAQNGPLLGGNVNENLTWATPEALAQSHTTWLRVFVPASEFISGERSYQHDAGLAALVKAADSGHKIILTIKWDCAKIGGFGRIPAAGSPREQEAFRFSDRLMERLSGKLSVLVVNNELTIDTQKQDLRPESNGQIPVINFLRRLVTHLQQLHSIAADGKPLPLYAGGMTRLDLKQNQRIPATRAMIRWINQDARIAGADLHLHQANMQDTIRALRFMRNQVPDKALMVTEFSLIHRWKRHLGDQLAATDAGRQFVEQYHLPSHMTVAQYMTKILNHPVPQQQWNAFMLSQPWVEQHYINEMIQLFTEYKIKVATYSLIWHQKRPERKLIVTPRMTPWLFDPIMIPAMVRSSNSMAYGTHGDFFNDYVNYQKKLNGTPQ